MGASRPSIIHGVRTVARRRFPRRRTWPCKAFTEPLERRLLLATVSGTKWNDVDGDGTQDATRESGIGGWTIYVDRDNDAIFDAGEPSDVTDARGDYSITFSATNGVSNHIREVPQTGWRVTAPAAAEHVVVFTAGSQNAPGRDFGNTQRALVTGVKFNDQDDDGVRDALEPLLSGWRIYDDVDNDGTYDGRVDRSDVTDANGAYALNLPAGAHTIREVQQAGWQQTAPASGAHAVNLSAGQVLANRNFGNIAATYDLYGVGLVALPDPVPGGGQVNVTYAVRNDGTADSGAFFVGFYLSDDATITVGQDDLLTSRLITSVPRHGSVQLDFPLTLPATDPFRTDNQYFIGMRVDSTSSIAETNETNNSNRGNGLDRYAIRSEQQLPGPTNGSSVLATTIGAESTTVGMLGDEWIGAYDRDIYRFDGVAGHTLRATVAGSGAVMGLYDSTWTPVVPSYSIVFQNVLPATGSYYFVVNGAANKDGNPRTLAGRVAAGTGSYTLSLSDLTFDLFPTDLFLSAEFGDGRTSVLYEVQFANVDSFNGPPDAIQIAFYLSDDPVISPASDLLITVHTDNPPNSPRPTEYSGVVELALPPTDPFRTDNQYWIGMVVDPANQFLERSESNNLNQGIGIDLVSRKSENYLPSPVDGATVDFIEIGFGNPRALAIGDEWIGPYDVDGYEIQPHAGERLRFDIDRTSGAIDSHIRLYDGAWALLAQNDNAAAPGESLSVDSYLEYTFAAAGTYRLIVSAHGNHTSDPRLLTGRQAASTGGLTLTVTFEPAGPISGSLFDDSNANGARDAGEPPLAGWTVYLDNDDLERPNEPQASQPQATSDANGAFTILGALPGSYVLRQVPKAGWIKTVPTARGYPLAVSSAQSLGGYLFGNAREAIVSGAKFNDRDGDGVRDAGEPGLPGWLIYRDLNGNGVRDLNTVTVDATGMPKLFGDTITAYLDASGPPAFVTDVNMTFGVTYRPGGDFDASLYRGFGGGLGVQLFQDFDGFGFSNTTLDDEAERPLQDGVPFYDGTYRPPGSLSVFDGSDYQGYWGLSLRNRQFNGLFLARLDRFSLTLTLSEPYAITDASGNYSFNALLPGPHQFREEQQPGWAVTSPVAFMRSRSPKDRSRPGLISPTITRRPSPT